MARPRRIEFADAVYHVTSRGDRREAIYGDDEDRQRHLAVIAQATDRFDAQVLAYCLMGNHYHLVVQTRQANLSRLMRHLNGISTQQFNRRHGLWGTCSRAASKPSWWTEMPTYWRCAAMSSATRLRPAW